MKSGVESEDSLPERERVSSLQYWQHPLKKRKKKTPNPVFHETTSFAAAAKKKTPEQLNRLINGVYRDATKDEKLQMTVWMKNSKQTK